MESIVTAPKEEANKHLKKMSKYLRMRRKNKLLIDSKVLAVVKMSNGSSEENYWCAKIIISKMRKSNKK